MGLITGDIVVVNVAAALCGLASLPPHPISPMAVVRIVQHNPPPHQDEVIKAAIQCGCKIGIQTATAVVFEVKMPQKAEVWDAEFEHEKCTKIGERPCQIPFYRKLPSKRGKTRRR